MNRCIPSMSIQPANLNAPIAKRLMRKTLNWNKTKKKYANNMLEPGMKKKEKKHKI